MLNLKNTLDGYLKNVEVIGNTVQDTNNLADIRSVGDKVEGQELYKIDVLSWGKNIWKAVVPKKSEFERDLFQPAYYGAYIIGLKPNTQYIIHVNNPIVPQGQWVVLNVKSDSLIPVLNIDNAGGSGNNKSYPASIMSDELGRIGISLYLHNAKSQEHWDTFYNLDVQLEEGTQATPYEPYQEYKLEILSPTQLEKVGDVADRIICKDGVWGIEKNIGNVVLTGSESWTKYITKGNVCSWLLTMDLPFKADPWKNDNAISNYNINKYAVAHPSSDWTQYINTIAFVGGYHTINAKHVVAIFLDLSVKLKDKLSEKPMLLKYQTTQPQFVPLPHDQQVKLRTFAGQTNIVFNTEIAGQIKAQVPKSLGATVNTHTEQIADLHNSLDRVKKLEETTVSTVETESNFTTVDATSNGYFEDVKLEGKTLVNINDCSASFITSQSTICHLPTSYSDLRMIKPNTIYTAIVFGRTNKFNNNFIITDIMHTSQLNNNGVCLFKTFSEIDYARKFVPHLYGSGLTEEDSKNLKLVILEGDHTNNLPEYFEGLMSAGQDVEEVNVESSNLHKDILHRDGYKAEYNASGHIVSVASRPNMFGEVVEVKPNTSYVVTFNENSTFNPRIYGYTYMPKCPVATPHQQVILQASSTDKNYTITFTTLPNVNYLFIGRYDGQEFNTNYQLKYASTGIEVVFNKNKKPLLYYNPTTETWEKPILREWDTIEKHSDGKYYYHKRSEEVVLNGSENWGVRLNGDYVVGYMTKLNNMYFNQDTPFGFCDKFRVLPNSIWESLEDKIWNSTHQLQISIKNTKLSTQDVAGFKVWLQSNPTTIVYRLVQEEVYECTNIDLMTYSGETNYIINSGAISPKSLLKVHNNISNVVKILQEKVSLLENTFIAGLKSVLSGDMYSLATILYPEDFEQNDNTEQDIMVIPE